jgi:hypothetical protein
VDAPPIGWDNDEAYEAGYTECAEIEPDDSYIEAFVAECEADRAAESAEEQEAYDRWMALGGDDDLPDEEQAYTSPYVAPLVRPAYLARRQPRAGRGRAPRARRHTRRAQARAPARPADSEPPLAARRRDRRLVGGDLAGGVVVLRRLLTGADA